MHETTPVIGKLTEKEIKTNELILNLIAAEVKKRPELIGVDLVKEYEKIKEKQSNLSASLRRLVIRFCELDGINFNAVLDDAVLEKPIEKCPSSGERKELDRPGESK